MPTVTFQRHSRGIDRRTPQLQLPPGTYRTLKNLKGSDDALEVRPGRTRYLTQIHASLPVTALTRVILSSVAGASGDPKTSGTQANDTSVGSFAWASPANAATEDGNEAHVSGLAAGSNGLTNYLKLTNFGFVLPASAVVTGIKVEIRRRSVTPGARDGRIAIIKGGVISSAFRKSPDVWPSTSSMGSYGGEGDLWGETFLDTDIEASGFGVAIAADIIWPGGESPSGAAYVDVGRITVYYTNTPVAAGNEILAFVDTTLYSDKTAAWAGINGVNVLSSGAQLAIVVWKGFALIQDNVNGPYKYDGTTFSVWDAGGAGGTAPPKAKFMLFSPGEERIYCAYTNDAQGASAIRAGTVDDHQDFPTVTTASGAGGVLMYAGRSDGDEITAVGRVGTMKFFFKHKSAYRLAGDNGETWDLKKILDVGCECPGSVQDCNGVLVWTDGRRVYALSGEGFDENFGQEIEPFLKATPLTEWPQRFALFWDGQYWLWYAADRVAMYDFRTGSWNGPYETLPGRCGFVDRLTGLMYVGSHLAGDVWKITGETDDGTAIAWEAETGGLDYEVEKGAGGPAYTKRARHVFVRADGGMGTITAVVLNEAGGQVSRTLSFGGSVVQTKKANVKLDGSHLIVRLSGSGAGGRIYQFGLEADPLRKSVA